MADDNQSQNQGQDNPPQDATQEPAASQPAHQGTPKGHVRVRVLHGRHQTTDGVVHDTGHVIDVPHRAFIAFRDKFEPVSDDTLTHYEQEALDEETQAMNLKDQPSAHLAARRIAASAGPGIAERPNTTFAKDGVTSSSTQRDQLNRHAIGAASDEENAAAAATLEQEQRMAEAATAVPTAARPAQPATQTSAENENEE